MQHPGQATTLQNLEDQFYERVNKVISDKITPIYNTFILIFAAGFAYFIVMEQPECYSKD